MSQATFQINAIARIAVGAVSILALSACHLLDPWHEEKARILEELDEPNVSFFVDIRECPARPDLVRGVVQTPGPEQKLVAISFILERPAVDGDAGQVHWAPTPHLEYDGDLLTNRYYARLTQCEFAQLMPATEGRPDLCAGAYCPCDGETEFDIHACQMSRHEPDNPMYKAQADLIEEIGLKRRSDYQKALELRDQQVDQSSK